MNRNYLLPQAFHHEKLDESSLWEAQEWKAQDICEKIHFPQTSAL